MSEKTETKECVDEHKKCGECFKCRHHDTIRTTCRVTGKKCGYPTKNCTYKDYPWGI